MQKNILENKRYHNIILIAVVAIGFFARLYQFGVIPMGINQDEAMAAVDSLALTMHGTDRYGMWLPVHFTAWGFGQMSVLMSYLMIPFIRIMGLTIISTRLPMLIVSLLGMYVMYKFVKDIYGKTPALITLFILAINPWHIMQSRWALDCNMFPHFMLFSIYFLYKGLKKDIFLYISMVLFAITLYAYGLAIYSVPIFLMAVFIYLLRKKQISLKKALICGVIFLTFAWPILLMLMINFFEWRTIEAPFFTIPFFEHSIRSNDLVFFADYFGPQLIHHTLALHRAITLGDGLLWNSINNFGPMYLFSILFLPLGIVFISLFSKYEESEKSIGNILIIFWLLISVFVGLSVSVNVNRINIIFYPLIIANALGICLLIKLFANKIVIAGTLLIYLISFIYFSNAYFNITSENLRQIFLLWIWRKHCCSRARRCGDNIYNHSNFAWIHFKAS